jgi:hypothetical protein
MRGRLIPKRSTVRIHSVAPLVTVPVTLERTGAKGRVVDAFLEYSGEDIDTKLSLVEKMRRDFGVS